MRWGLVDLTVWRLGRPGIARDVAVAGEQAGWDAVFVWDHLWNRTSAPFADRFVTPAAIAAAAERVLIGTMVTALPRPRPQLVAQATTSLDRLSADGWSLASASGSTATASTRCSASRQSTTVTRGAALDAGIGLLEQMLAGGSVAGAAGRVTTGRRSTPSVPIWIAGRVGLSAGPRRVRRYTLEGLALVDTDVRPPEHVTTALRAGDLAPGDIDVALVGRTHPDTDASTAAGATWCIPQILPAATAAAAMAMAATPPG